MNLPALPSFRAEAFPGAPAWLAQLLLMLNQALRPLQLALTRIPERGEALDKSFTTNNLGAAFVDLKVSLSPRHLWIGQITPESGDLDNVWGYSWRKTSAGMIRVLFVGLTASSKYSFSAVYE